MAFGCVSVAGFWKCSHATICIKKVRAVEYATQWLFLQKKKNFLSFLGFTIDVDECSKSLHSKLCSVSRSFSSAHQLSCSKQTYILVRFSCSIVALFNMAIYHPPSRFSFFHVFVFPVPPRLHLSFFLSFSTCMHTLFSLSVFYFGSISVCLSVTHTLSSHLSPS